MTLDPLTLGGIVAHCAKREPDKVLRLWWAAGLECAVLMGYVSPCGYVRLPAPFRSRRLLDDDMDIEAPGGLTYGMDEAGWIGFDTGHGWDAWLDPDAPESEYERSTRELAQRDPRYAALRRGRGLAELAGATIWTLERLEAEVTALAERAASWCAAHGDFESRESMEECLERQRREMRRIHELAQVGDPGEIGWSYDDATHERMTEAMRRVFSPTVAELREDYAAGLLPDREFEWKLDEALRREDDDAA